MRRIVIATVAVALASAANAQGWRIDSRHGPYGRTVILRPLGPPDDGVRHVREAPPNGCDLAGYVGALEIVNPAPGERVCVGGTYEGL